MIQSFLYVTYSITTGEIFQTGRAGLDDDFTWLPDGQWLMEGSANSLMQYVDITNNDIISKPSQIATTDKATVLADGIDFATISAIEQNSEIFINGISKGINPDTDIELTFDTIGEYRITIVMFPFIDQEIIINAN